MSTVDNNRPPYVTFERRAVEDRSKSLESGQYSSMDVDFAIITRPGSKDDLHKEAGPWLEEMKLKARKQEIPQEWATHFSALYKAFLEGEELPTTGTPLKTWPVINPAALKDLLKNGIRTVEDLADLPDSDLPTIGMGAVALKQKAKAWLLAAKDTGKVAEQVAAQNVQIAQLVELAKNQAKELDELRKQLPQPDRAERPKTVPI